MKIYIPTLGRAGRVRLPQGIPLDRVLLVVQPQEYDTYVPYVNDLRFRTNQNLRLLRLPGPYHIGATRKWIIDFAGEDHWQMDDDVTMRFPAEYDTTLSVIVQEAENALKNCAMVGFGRQYMANIAMAKGRWHVGAQVWHMLGINYQRMKDVPVERFSLYEDTVMNIHALMNGGTLVDYAALLGNGSYAKTSGAGGCSTYRTQAEIERNMDKIVELYPQFCKILPSKSLTQGLPVGRTVRTSWSKIR